MTFKTALRGTIGLGSVCLLAGGVALAQGAPNDTATTQSDTGATQDDSPVSVAGRIDKVDRADDTIEIDGIDRQLKLDRGTRVTRNGAQGSFSDVQEGEQVRASFDDGFPAHVRQLEIMTSTGSNRSTSTGTPSDIGAPTSTAPTGSAVAPSTGSGATEPDSAPVGHPLPATPSGTGSGSR